LFSSFITYVDNEEYIQFNENTKSDEDNIHDEKCEPKTFSNLESEDGQDKKKQNDRDE
jgi:hypothetical protein